MIYKTCLLCDLHIKSSYRLCKQHFIEYHQYMNEPWFKALIEEDQKQEQINRYEGYRLPYNSPVDIHGAQDMPELLLKRAIGRPSTDWMIVNRVLEIYDQSVENVKLGIERQVISLRAIARRLDNVIGYVTVRNILREYRGK
jgi:hypothetical protein